MNVEQALIPGLPDDVAASCLLRVDYTKIDVFASVCRRWRQEFRSPEFLHRRRISGLTQPIFAFYLLDKLPDYHRYIGYILLFDPKSSQWRRLPPIPTNPASLAENYDLVQAGHRMAAVHTWSIASTVPTVYIYDLLANTWRTGAPCPIRNRRIPACASDGVRKIFVAGGSRNNDHNDRLEVVSTAVSYDVDTDTWHMLPDMAKTRAICHGYFHAGIFHVIGSLHTDTDPPTQYASAEQYDVSTGDWRLITKFAPIDVGSSVGGSGGFLAPDGKYYRFIANGTKLTVKRGQSWALVGNLPAAVCDRRCFWALFAWKGGFVMAKGWSSSNNVVCMLPYVGDHSQNISYTQAMMPSDYQTASVVTGCCLEI